MLLVRPRPCSSRKGIAILCFALARACLAAGKELRRMESERVRYTVPRSLPENCESSSCRLSMQSRWSSHRRSWVVTNDHHHIMRF